jgi:hypothetical protein
MEERNESRMKREATATNNGATAHGQQSTTTAPRQRDPKQWASRWPAKNTVNVLCRGGLGTNSSGMSNSGMGNAQNGWHAA